MTGVGDGSPESREEAPAGLPGLEGTGIPLEFDGYRLLREIGRGGMGSVYLGMDTVVQRNVAIKFISATNPGVEARRQFLTEARAVARLHHPCVVTIFRAAEIAGHPYIISEFIEGRSLDHVEMPVPWPRALEIGYELARGIAVAHANGVIHRDIKPANVMLTEDGTVKILDFGIAVLSDAAEVSPVDEAMRSPPCPGGMAADDDGDAGSTVRVTRPPPALPAEGEAGAARARPQAVVGTPAFIAPEVWCGLPATFASDVYSLGALLHVLCTGRPPHDAGTATGIRDLAVGKDAPRLSGVIPDIDPAFSMIVERCLARDPAERYRTCEDLRSALSNLVYGKRRDITFEGNPYRGLRPFEAEHQALFFGRDSELGAILERLSADPMVIIAGDSGVGKSSLCRSGILPRVQDWLGDGRQWSSITVRPGRNPLEALIHAAARALGVPTEDLRAALLEGPDTFTRTLCRSLGKGRGLVVFIDQLEELATASERPEASALAEIIRQLAHASPGLKMLATIRSDFLGRIAAIPAMGGAIERSLYFLRPLSRERLREAITGPAGVKGIVFETEDLVNALVESTAQALGGLPLLQFALEKLWESRDEERKLIPAAALEALGGVAGALSLHADEALSHLRPAQAEACRRILLRLIAPEGTRAVMLAAELTGIHPDAQATLESLVRERILVARSTPDGPAYEIAHEALIDGWKTLARWRANDTDQKIVRERLHAASVEWERLGRPAEYLWNDRRVVEVSRLGMDELSFTERRFLAESVRVIRRRKTARLAVAVGLVAAMASVWGGIELKSASDMRGRIAARVQEGRALIRVARLSLDRLGKAEVEAFAAFDAGDLEGGEEAWRRLQDGRRGTQEKLSEAGQAMEIALMLDPGREETNALLSEVLFRRALLAEEQGDAATVKELLMRLEVHDSTGTYLARWKEPGQLEVEASPEPGEVVLERYVRGADGRLDLVAVPTDGVKQGSLDVPIRGRRLAPGSYRLVFRATGRSEVIVPFTIDRGERLALDVWLPPVDSVPQGFVYLPPGHFFFGTEAEDGVRKGFMHTVPIHRVQSGAFLIAREETTFGEWIEYLESLPEAERTARIPRVLAGGFEGSLDLAKLPDGRWQLSFRPTIRSYTVASGETLAYPGRPGGGPQDWLRFPVVGVSADDARAYASWLDRTGRVPGARLCTELEWERAASGADERPFPHGPLLSPDDANFDMTYGKDPLAMGPDEVGSHLASTSPFGLHDMAGNVWEWTVSVLGDARSVARGGSFYFDASSARVANRETPEPSFRDVSVGFRVCADPPPPD